MQQIYIYVGLTEIFILTLRASSFDEHYFLMSTFYILKSDFPGVFWWTFLSSEVEESQDLFCALE